MSPETSNPELLLYALFRLGGASEHVSLEDLFEECWRIAPSRFGWQTKPYPSDKNGDQAIRHLSKEEELKDFLNLSPDRGSVRLTAEGVAWVRDNLKKFENLAEKRAPSTKRSQRHLIDLERSAIGQALLRDDDLTASRVEVADLLRLTPDADPAAFRQRLVAYRADAELAARGDALAILERLEAARPDWFSNGTRPG